MDEKLRPEGYYWIKRNEPDGPSVWEPAKFRHSHYVPDGPVEVHPDGLRSQKMKPGGGPCWYVIGSGYPEIPPKNPNASNAWKFGPAIEAPALS